MSSHLVTTRAIPATCRCGSLILAGHAEGLTARADPVPLNPAGALAALLAGRATYILNRGELVHRDQSRIRGGTIRGPILGEHRCGAEVPPEHRDTTMAPPIVKNNEAEGIPY